MTLQRPRLRLDVLVGAAVEDEGWGGGRAFVAKQDGSTAYRLDVAAASEYLREVGSNVCS
jgi:hypothetical protein